MRTWGAGVLLAGMWVAACSSSEERPSTDASQTSASPSKPATASAVLSRLQQEFPRAQVETARGKIARVYGAPLSIGASPSEAAERFRQEHAAALGVDAAALKPHDGSNGGAPQPIGLMLDPKTGQFRYSLYQYRQEHAGTRVYHAGLRALVRNGGQNAVVWAASSVRELGSFVPRSDVVARAADDEKTLAAIRALPEFSASRVTPPSALTRLSKPELVVYAGTDESEATPALAVNYVAETAKPPGRWDVVADAVTGDVLHVESLLAFDDVRGTVLGNVTTGGKTMECDPSALQALSDAEVVGGGSSVFTDADGAFVFPTAGTDPVDLTSTVNGRYFTVTNAAGANEALLATVAPPGPASFVHNQADTDASVRAMVNAYAKATEARHFALKYLPNYPVIASQEGFPVVVNRTDLYCPGSSWYDGAAINFCLGDSNFTNTAYGGAVYHEYAHHLVQSGGSGQGEYGEGMADAVEALITGDPGQDYGLTLTSCSLPLRSADNTCQYSAASCSSCGSANQTCGMLLSGIVWSIRQALAQSDPATYADLVNSLVLSSILLHQGTSITPSIAIDMLTLDDDDGILANGSPHYDQICAGFQAHGMSCPPRSSGLTLTPNTPFIAAGPVGGPFTPASTVYTLRNVGPEPTLSFGVTSDVPTPWLSISPVSGALAKGEQMDVTVAIDPATAGAKQGAHAATLSFTNQTDGVGSMTVPAHLSIGDPSAVFSDNFEQGLGGFTFGTELGNLWQRTNGCAAALPGHSSSQVLFFGTGCFVPRATTSVIYGTVVSSPITLSDTSVANLGFNYYFGDSGARAVVSATVDVSVNGGNYTTVVSGTTAKPLVEGTGAWNSMQVDLTPLLKGLNSATLRVRFGFRDQDTFVNFSGGFAVDDVTLTAFSKGCMSDAECDDGQFCNGQEICNASGACQAGPPANCDDGNLCTADSCTQSGCVHTAISCNDGSVCTTDSCDPSVGCVHAAVSCDDSNACTADACSPTLGCSNSPVNCDDGNACTIDSCDPSTGCLHTPVTCDDGNACTTDSCNPAGGCQFVNNTNPCTDDGNVCTDDVCSAGICAHPNNTASCTDDGNSCTSDVCSAGACTHPNNGSCNTGPFQESGGQVVIEAEHFSSTVARNGHTWVLGALSAASGGELMQCVPNNGALVNNGYTVRSPELDYPVSFSTPGTYQVWIRGFGAGSGDRTVHAGIDGVGTSTADRISGFGSTLGWSKNTLDGVVATLNVARAGVHTINLWMREDGFQVDKIVLTRSTSFVPSGPGPAESSRLAH